MEYASLPASASSLAITFSVGETPESAILGAKVSKLNEMPAGHPQVLVMDHSQIGFCISRNPKHTPYDFHLYDNMGHPVCIITVTHGCRSLIAITRTRSCLTLMRSYQLTCGRPWKRRSMNKHRELKIMLPGNYICTFSHMAWLNELCADGAIRCNYNIRNL